MKGTKAIDRAIEIAGSQRKLARLVGVSDQAVSQWVGSGHVPLPRIREVSQRTGITVADLLMDFDEVLQSDPIRE